MADKDNTPERRSTKRTTSKTQPYKACGGNCSLKINPHNQDEWYFAARTLLKTILADHNISYFELAERMAQRGLPGLQATAIKNRINRGRFSAAFLMQVVFVLEGDGVDLRGVKVR